MKKLPMILLLIVCYQMNLDMTVGMLIEKRCATYADGSIAVSSKNKNMEN